MEVLAFGTVVIIIRISVIDTDLKCLIAEQFNFIPSEIMFIEMGLQRCFDIIVNSFISL